MSSKDGEYSPESASSSDEQYNLDEELSEEELYNDSWSSNKKKQAQNSSVDIIIFNCLLSFSLKSYLSHQ